MKKASTSIKNQALSPFKNERTTPTVTQRESESFSAWKDEKNWKVVEKNCGVKQSAAYKWIQRYRELQIDEELSDEPEIPKNKPRAGREPTLPKNEQEKIAEFIEEDPEITIEDLKDKIRQRFGVSVSTTTVWRYIEGQLINVKKIHYEPVTMNNLQNRVARKEFLTKLLSYEADQKTIIYLDETNFNVFCRRAYGRSKVSERCKSVKPASKGHNLTIIVAITVDGILHWSTHRGSFRKNNFKEWMIAMKEKAQHERQWTPEQFVVVLDNAPVHSALKILLKWMV